MQEAQDVARHVCHKALFQESTKLIQNKHSLIEIVGLFVCLALLLAGCGSGSISAASMQSLHQLHSLGSCRHPYLSQRKKPGDQTRNPDWPSGANG
jgi:hypothetical protein